MNALLFNTSSVKKVVHGHKTANSLTDDDVDGPGTGIGGSATSMVDSMMLVLVIRVVT